MSGTIFRFAAVVPNVYSLPRPKLNNANLVKTMKAGPSSSISQSITDHPPFAAARARRATLDDELDALSRDLLELAAAWAQVSVTGLSRDAARRVVFAELTRLRELAIAMEGGL